MNETAGWQLAQLNVARMRGPLEAPVMSGFVARLDEINGLAEASPGFVWRLKDDSLDDATYIQAYEDPTLLVNMSVWESLDALRAFVYRSRHLEVLRAGHNWFQPMTEPYLALWWVPAGARPSLDDAKQRLQLVRREGPTSEAFTFAKPFAPVDTPSTDAT